MIRVRLSAILGDRRLKVTTLARMTGVSYTTLHEIYHERTLRIDFNTLVKLCTALGCRPGDLLEHVPDGEPHS